MAIFDVDLYEPISAVVTADTTAYTADNAIWPTADGGLLEGATDQLDAIVIAISEAIIVETADAADVLDAEIISVPVVIGVGGGRRPEPRPLPVIGVGYGVLPQLEGEAFGTVIVAGAGVGTFAKLEGEATGSAGVAGRSAGQFVISAAAIGNNGQAGIAVAILKHLSIAGGGAVGVHGSGSGTIVKLKGAGSGRHDDDEAVVMTFLLAA
jgi:hypothetical protein